VGSRGDDRTTGGRSAKSIAHLPPTTKGSVRNIELYVTAIHGIPSIKHIPISPSSSPAH
jgi:hypothetical protein